MKTKILRMRVSGFGCFLEEQSVTFSEVGRVLIVGVNEDTASADSNGAGKTTIFKALTWGLYGKTVDGLTTDVIHRDAKAAEVEVFLEAEDGGVYAVTRRRTPKTGKLLFEAVVGKDSREDLSQTKAAATQASIEDMLGADFETFRCTTLFGQGDHSRFASPLVGDAQRKSIIAKVLGLERFAVAREEMTERRADLSSLLSEKEREQGRVQRRIVEAEADVARHEGELRGLNTTSSAALEEKIERLEERRGAAVDEAAKADLAAAACDPRVEELEEEKREAERDVLSVAARLESEAFADARAARRALASLTSGPAADAVCPTCGKPLDVEETPEAAIAAAERALEEAEALLKKRKTQHAQAREHVEEIDEDLRTARTEANGWEVEARAARRRAKEIGEEVEELNEQLRTLEEAKALASAKIADAEARAIGAREELAALRLESETLTKEHLAVDWWVRVGLGGKGVPAFAIERSLPAINARANEHLAILSGGDIRVRWSATTTGSSGAEKEELTQHVEIEGVPGAAPSGGQQKKIELATEVALAQIQTGREGLGLLLLDEALDGLDAQGARLVCTWLEELGAESIFVVTHSADVADDFDAALTVTKRGGASTIEADR